MTPARLTSPKVGISPTMKVTGAMIDMYADVSGDHTPLHVDEEYARKSHFGERVAHENIDMEIWCVKIRRYRQQSRLAAEVIFGE